MAKEADVQWAIASDKDLREADLTKANLSGVNLEGGVWTMMIVNYLTEDELLAGLEGPRKEPVLRGTNLCGAFLAMADLTDANLEGPS